MKTLLFKIGSQSFYDDWTYRCDDWLPGQYSLYKFEDGKVLYNHPWHQARNDWWGHWDLEKGRDIISTYNELMFGIMEKAFGLVE